jgi:hypothetical protein
MATSGGAGGTMAADLGISVVGVGGMRVSIRDLIHPSLNDSLKGQQQVTFKLVKTGQFDHLNITKYDMKKIAYGSSINDVTIFEGRDSRNL